MTADLENTPENASAEAADAPRGAVIAGVIPDQNPRIMTEAARYAKLLGAPLVVVNVDVTRFVTYEDPDGYVHSSPIDIEVGASESDLAQITEAAEKALAGSGIDWTVRQLVGDPALAMKALADKTDAKLFVVGTRKRGIGESIREFFTGSVAARLTHRQHRPVLVVPLGDLVADDEEIAWGE